MTRAINNPSLFSDFSKWVNRHPDLDSRTAGVVFTDIDNVVHKYVSHCDGIGTREIQYMMLLETKTNGADLPLSQKDTLHMMNQLIRTTPWRDQREDGRFITGHRQNTRKVYSWQNQVKVQLVCFGIHVLRMSGTTPENSEWMLWDKKKITTAQLLSLLRFETHPDTLQPLSPRRHKRRRCQSGLFDNIEGSF